MPGGSGGFSRRTPDTGSADRHRCHLPSPGLLIAVWLAGGLITICGALSFAELGAMYPQAGGQYVYIREAYGPGASFLFGWAFFGFIMCGGLAALAVAFAEFLGSSAPVLSTGHILFRVAGAGLSYSPSAGQVVAALSILALTFVNTFGIRSGATFQNLLTVIRLGTVAALVGAGIFLGAKAGEANFQSLFPAGPTFPGLLIPLGSALVAVFWTYDGWYSLNCTAEEIRDPGRTIPRGLTPDVPDERDDRSDSGIESSSLGNRRCLTASAHHAPSCQYPQRSCGLW